MAIPLPTTTIALLAPKSNNDSESDDWGVAEDYQTGFDEVETGIRAHLSSRINIATPSAFGQFTSAGNTEQLKYRLICDPCSLAPEMQVRDETTGLEYDVVWVIPRPEPMRHMVASITRSLGTP